MFSCEFSKISKNTFSTEHLRTTTSAFSFSEAATGGVLWKRFSWKSCKIYRKTSVVCEIFKNTFFTEHLCNCNFTKIGHCQQCSENFRWILFTRQHKLLVYVFIGLHCLLPEAARVEVFCKKGVLKNFVNFIGKCRCWSLSLIKLQAWHLLQRTSAKDCFCTAHTAVTVT